VLSNGDFGNVFDLKSEAQNFIYRVEVSDQQAFINLLEQNTIHFEVHDHIIKFELDERAYKALFKQSVLNGIEFSQIKKESKFAELIK
jgi:hypothetical protein